jgi:hypothetical protein
MIARLWDGAKACGRFAGWLLRWYFALGILWEAAVWVGGSVLAGHALNEQEFWALMGKCLGLVGLN